MRTFTFAGSSVLQGKLKVRYANDMLRVKTLEKAGHTAIDLQPMPAAMTKLEIVSWMLDTSFAGRDIELQAVITAEKARLEGKNKRADAPAVIAAQETEDVQGDDEIDEDEAAEFDDFEVELLQLIEDETVEC